MRVGGGVDDKRHKTGSNSNDQCNHRRITIKHRKEYITKTRNGRRQGTYKKRMFFLEGIWLEHFVNFAPVESGIPVFLPRGH